MAENTLLPDEQSFLQTTPPNGVPRGGDTRPEMPTTKKLPLEDSVSDRTVATPVTVDQPTAKQIGPYRLLREIGRGAMGAVYEAEHTSLQKRVALKVLPPDFAAVPERLDRFRREMIAIGKLDHSNIVRANDAGEVEGNFFIAMDFIAGPDLARLLGDNGRVSVPQAAEAIRQAALGLQHIHENKLVHRDIKPSNLLLAEDGTIKILDLGIAMLRQEGDGTDLTSANSMMGTPDYMAPEQINCSRDVDIRADIYSLGCTLFSLVAGVAPFSGPEYETFTSKLLAHAEHQPPKLRTLDPTVPRQLSRIVEKMMAKDAADRFQTPIEVAKELTKFGTGENLNDSIKQGARRRPLVAKRAASHQSWKSAVRLLLSIATLVGIAAFILRPKAPTEDASKALRVAPEAHVVVAGSEREKANGTPKKPTSTTTAIARKSSKEVPAIATTPQTESQPRHQLYSEAMSLDQMGEYDAAKQRYLEYFASQPNAIDPHEAFQRFLKINDGLEAAREIYETLPGDNTTSVRRLARIMLQPETAQQQPLRQLISDDSDFPLSYYYLNENIERHGKDTLAEQRERRQLLTEFVQLHEQDKLLSFYVSRSAVPGMLLVVQEELKQLTSLDEVVPVEFDLLRVDIESNWRMYLTFEEMKTQKSAYRTSPTADFVPTKPDGDMIVYALLPNESCQLEVKYWDANGKECGPFHYDWDFETKASDYVRQELAEDEDYPVRIAFASLDFGRLSERYRSAIKKIEYGLNTSELTHAIEPVPKDHSVKFEYTNFGVGETNVKYATVQWTYVDGKKSDPVRVESHWYKKEKERQAERQAN